jgi:hypothetical protein
MSSVHPFARERSFDPNTRQIMGVALDCAWYELLVSGSALTASFRADHTREALALYIAAKARLGERDVNCLRDYAVAHAKENLDVEPQGATERLSADQLARKGSLPRQSSDGDYCRVKADECARLAEAVLSTDVKAKLLKLAQRWLEEAAKADAKAVTPFRFDRVQLAERTGIDAENVSGGSGTEVAVDNSTISNNGTLPKW